MEKEELEKLGIFDFEIYENSLEITDILIGNGFSINLCNRLDYNSLCALFNQSASAEIKKIFKGFETTNFEKILEALANTEAVNNILGNDNTEIKKLKIELKQGLISSIQQTHPKAAEIREPMLRSLAKDFEPFRDIFTTNYDVFLYKIILANNMLCDMELETFEKFNDGFYEELSPGKLGFEDFDAHPRNLIYLHGALFLFAPNGHTFKLKRLDDGVEFIKLIQQYLDHDEFPVYVAEGKYLDKWEAINSNYYLRTAYDRLKHRDSENLVVYGFSFSKPDDHITSAINLSNTKRILISLRPRATKQDMEVEMSRLRLKFPNIEVSFFNSDSLFTFDHPKNFY
ncbi:MAG: DUF4917 family protein [Chitinophagaceae bacterium]|nr:MAG: DUF4917 family protein [Chitinophagaceae bacterium]